MQRSHPTGHPPCIAATRWLIPTALVLSTACASYSTMHTARPMPSGETQITVAPLSYGSAGLDQNGLAVTGEFLVRHGFNDMLDFGVRYVWPFTLAFDVNVALIDSEDLVLSINPSVMPWYNADNDGGSSYGIYGFLPLLADVISTESLTLTLAFKPGAVYGSNTSRTRDGFERTVTGYALFVGGGAGLRIMITDAFGLLPEITLLYDPLNRYVLWNVAFGFIFNIL